MPQTLLLEFPGKVARLPGVEEGGLVLARPIAMQQTASSVTDHKLPQQLIVNSCANRWYTYSTRSWTGLGC